MSELCMVKEATEGIRACAWDRSLGGRNVKGSAFALAIGQWPSGVVVNTEKGPGMCAFVLPVSACSHQHAGEKKVTQSCASPGPEVFWSLWRSWQPPCFQHGGSLGQTCTPTSPELHPGHPGRG